jgi:hypothetical protein
MAEFHPQEPEELWRDGDTRPSNETELLFRKTLEIALADKPWIVIQNLVVQAFDRVGSREIDFLVIDPRRGMVVIEVKGGDYQFSPRFGWHRPTDDPDDPEVFTRGAPKQASTAMFHLVNYIAARLLHDASRPPYLHGWLVALPDAEIKQSTLPPEAQGHVIDAKHCRDPQRLAADIDDLLGALELKFGSVVCGEDSCMGEITRQHILPSMQVRFAVRDDIRHARTIENDAMRPVRLVMDAAHEMDRLLVRGHPGTGKTFATLHRASRDLREGKRVLVLCFNIPLAASLTARLRAQPVRAETPPGEIRERQCVVARIFALAENAARHASPSPALPPASDGPAYYAALLGELAAAARAGAFGRFDSVIVDEGQDFSPAMLDALDALAGFGCEGKTRLALFHDPDQRLYDGASERELCARFGQPLVLRENLRNSRTITEFLRTLDPARLGGLTAPPSVRRGQPVVVWEYAHGDTAAQLQAIERIVQHLTEAEDVADNDIALLSPFTYARSSLAGVQNIRGLPILSLEAAARRGPDAPPCLRHETLHRFKGLEAPAVILHDVAGGGRNVSFEAILTACSRAQHALYVLRSSNYAGGAALPVQGELP